MGAFNLPPGCTLGDIERACGGGRDPSDECLNPGGVAGTAAGGGVPVIPQPLRVFAVRCTLDDSGRETIVAAPTASKARYWRWLDVREAWENVPLTAMRSRVVREHAEPPGFGAVCRYRGITFARINMRVRFSDGREGRISGAAEHGACLAAVVDGVSLAFHPCSAVAYLDEAGAMIREFP